MEVGEYDIGLCIYFDNYFILQAYIIKIISLNFFLQFLFQQFSSGSLL